jgi:hypothetical protein
MMKCKLLPMAIALVLSGCATFSRKEIAFVQSRGVPPQIVSRLERVKPLTPADIILLTRRGVPDHYIARHIDAAGVNYLVTRNDAITMRRAGVSAAVIDRLLVESDDFARRYAEPPPGSYDYWWVDSVEFGPGFYHPYYW